MSTGDWIVVGIVLLAWAIFVVSLLKERRKYKTLIETIAMDEFFDEADQ